MILFLLLKYFLLLLIDVQVLLDSNIISNLAFLDSSNELLESPTNQSNLLNKHSSGNQFSKRNELDSEIQESQLVQFVRWFINIF